MVGLKEELERDIKDFVDKIDKMNDNDKLEALRNLFIKHLHLEEAEHFMNKFNFNAILASAKSHFVDLSNATHIDESKLTPEQLPNYCVMLATIGELRKEKVLHKVVKFKK